VQLVNPGMMTAKSEVSRSTNVAETYKARDVESALDIYFYRPLGYACARFFAQLHFSPSAVSLLGAAFGVLAGHLYFYRDLRLNLLGMVLHLGTNILDNADGQLARLTNRGSLSGAITDGFADYVVFLSIYVHLALRYVVEGGTPAVWLLALAAALSHAWQSMMIDHYRHAYLQFVTGSKSADENSSAAVRIAYERIGWNKFFRKLGLWNYLQYTRRQETFAPELLQLRQENQGALREQYRARFQPMIKWCNGLATNPRMLILFGLLLLGRPVWYFVVEVTALNLLLIYVIRRHNDGFRLLLRAESRPK
jgi:phosphatidylglycerophosphate synthase